MAEMLVRLAIVYDIGMILASGLVRLIRRDYLLVEKTVGGRTADEEGRASSEVLFRVLLQHFYFYINTFRDVSYSFSLCIVFLNGNKPYS